MQSVSTVTESGGNLQRIGHWSLEEMARRLANFAGEIPPNVVVDVDAGNCKDGVMAVGEGGS